METVALLVLSNEVPLPIVGKEGKEEHNPAGSLRSIFISIWDEQEAPGKPIWHNFGQVVGRTLVTQALGWI